LAEGKFIPNRQLESIDFEKYLSDLELIHFYGGEPLISPNLEKFLKNVARHCKKIRKISFSTGLKNVKKTNLELFKKYLPNCSLSANVSIDGPLDLNHWIRGIEEEEYKNNFKLLTKYSHISGFQITIGAYNFFAMPECVRTIENITKNLLNQKDLILMASPIIEPEILSVRQSPDHIKLKVNKKLESFLQESRIVNSIELIQTAINLSKDSSTMNWKDSLEYMQILPNFRNDPRDFYFWIEKYL
jgi:hypothetical protein